MAQFIIRVQLKDVAPDNGIYPDLHANLVKKHIHNVMYHMGNSTWYELPQATFYTHWYSGDNPAALIHGIVKQVIKETVAAYKGQDHPVNVTSHVLVAEAKAVGLPFYTDFPAASTPSTL